MDNEKRGYTADVVKSMRKYNINRVFLKFKKSNLIEN